MTCKPLRFDSVEVFYNSMALNAIKYKLEIDSVKFTALAPSKLNLRHTTGPFG